MANKPPNNVSGKNYGRKPYISKDYKELTKKVPRRAMLDQRAEKKSVFDRPYTQDSYPEMEHYYQLPGFELPEPQFAGQVPTNLEWPAPGSTACAVVCYSPHYECEDAVECHVGIVISGARSLGQFLQTAALRVRVNGKNHTSFEVVGKNRPIPIIEIYPPQDDPNYGCWLKWPDGQDTVELSLVSKETGYALCTYKLDVFCRKECECDCEDPPTGAFSIDEDSTPDTIDPGGSITVYVQGGCPPYTFSVSSTGYSFSPEETDDPYSTLSCAAGT